MSILEHLPKVVVGIAELIINYFAVFLNRGDLGIDESAVRLQTKCGIALENLFVKRRVDVYGIVFDQSLSGLVVAFRLDSLNLGQKLGKQRAEPDVIVDYEVCLSVADFLFYYIDR